MQIWSKLTPWVRSVTSASYVRSISTLLVRLEHYLIFCVKIVWKLCSYLLNVFSRFLSTEIGNVHLNLAWLAHSIMPSLTSSFSLSVQICPCRPKHMAPSPRDHWSYTCGKFCDVISNSKHKEGVLNNNINNKLAIECLSCGSSKWCCRIIHKVVSRKLH